MRRVLAVGLAAGVMLAGVWLAPPVRAAAATFTWTGADVSAAACESALPSCGANWSDPGNWQGGVAPASGASVNLVFPSPSCTVAGCAATNNDLSNLTVQNLTIGVAEGATSPYPQSYAISGNGIVLDGLAASLSTPAGGGHAPVLDLPITLGSDQTWALAGVSLVLGSTVSGAHTLNVDISKASDAVTSGGLDIYGSVDVAAVNVVGHPTGQAWRLGGVTVIGSLEPSGGPIIVTASAISGGTTGPITTSYDMVYPASLGNASAVLRANGNVTLDPHSELDFFHLSPGNGSPVPGKDYDQVAAAGAVSLNSIRLRLQGDCNQSVGTAYTLVSAAGGLTGTFSDQDGLPISNGEIVRPIAPGGSCSLQHGDEPYFRITYNSTSAVATVVSPVLLGSVSAGPGFVGCLNDGSPSHPPTEYNCLKVEPDPHAAGWFFVHAWTCSAASPSSVVTDEEEDVPGALQVGSDGSFSLNAYLPLTGNIYIQGFAAGPHPPVADDQVALDPVTNQPTLGTNTPLQYTLLANSGQLTTYNTAWAPGLVSGSVGGGSQTELEGVVWTGSIVGKWSVIGTDQ